MALGPLYALTTRHFGISPALRTLALLPCVTALLQRFRLLAAITAVYCALLFCAKLHALFGPPTAWL